MLVNVWEWVADWYGYYPGGTVTDTQVPASGSNRVFLGGGVWPSSGACRASHRADDSPIERGDVLGFRLLRME